MAAVDVAPVPSASRVAGARTGHVHIGISGYDYRGWRERFYPRELPRKRWLAYASERFDSIELNGTFYSLKNPDVFRRWVEETPARGFVFAVKGSRFITHNLKLRRAEPALANFYASGILALGRKTGPFLWQLPDSYPFDPERIESFVKLLPRTSADAETLARGHDARLRRGALTKAAGRVRYRHAFEVRHPSYFVPGFFDLLRRLRVGHVIADTAGKWTLAEEVTASFVYVRLHGSRVLYGSDYTAEELTAWAARVRRWSSAGRDVYVYFDNDHEAYAPHDALELARQVGAPAAGPSPAGVGPPRASVLSSRAPPRPPRARGRTSRSTARRHPVSGGRSR
jgi:uncharacterized protein YecE (DUF72 family)